MSDQFLKFPITPYIDGSVLLPIGLEKIPLTLITETLSLCSNARVSVTEKFDGTNVGISFVDGKLQLQHRGGYITHGKEFDLLKRYIHANYDPLYTLLGERYILFGEWLYYKHTIFYCSLPTYFMPFDLYDKQDGIFLPKKALTQFHQFNWMFTLRHSWSLEYDFTILCNLNEEDGVTFLNKRLLYALETERSYGIGLGWHNKLRAKATLHRMGFELLESQSQKSDRVEGFVIKIEDDKQVLLRCKVVNPDFVQTIEDSGHWAKRPPIKNIARFK